MYFSETIRMVRTLLEFHTSNEFRMSTYPLILDIFKVLRGSIGSGALCGVRQLEFRAWPDRHGVEDDHDSAPVREYEFEAQDGKVVKGEDLSERGDAFPKASNELSESTNNS
jgi:hypothetical protein